MRIGIDLDGVVFDFVGNLRDYLVSRGFDPATLPEAGVWDFFKYDWGLTTEEFLKYANEGVDEEFIFAQGKAYENAISSLHKLREAGHSLHIVTNRFFGSKSVANTESWLGANYVPYDSLTFSADKTVVLTDMFIEDNIDNVEELLLAGCNAVLLSRPWNEMFQTRAIIANDWNHFVDIATLVDHMESERV